MSKSTFWHDDYLEEKVTCKMIPLYYIINIKVAKFLIKSYQVHSSIELFENFNTANGMYGFGKVSIYMQIYALY